MIGAIVLAAGEGRRMGSAKQLLDWQGEPLIHYVVRRVLEARFDLVRVVIGAYANEVADCLQDLPIEMCYNPEFAKGQSSSVRIGLQNFPLEVRGMAFILGDQPLTRPETYDRLITCFREKEPGILIPTQKGQHGNPIFFHRDFFNSLVQVEGDRGGRELIRQNPDLVQTLEVGDAGILVDLDRREDYQYYTDTENNAKFEQAKAVRNGEQT